MYARQVDEALTTIVHPTTTATTTSTMTKTATTSPTIHLLESNSNIAIAVVVVEVPCNHVLAVVDDLVDVNDGLVVVEIGNGEDFRVTWPALDVG